MADYDRPRALAVRGLKEITETGAFANELLGQIFRKNDLPPLDRNFISALVYGCLDYLPYLDYLISFHSHYDLEKLDPYVLNILRLALWQIEFSEKIPNSAAVNEAVKLAIHFDRRGLASFVNGLLRQAIRQPVQLKARQVHLKYGMNSELYGLYKKWFGESEGQAILKSYLERREGFSLLFMGSPEDERGWLDQVLDRGLKVEPGYLLDKAYRVSGLTGPEDLPGFKEGLIYIQDEASMLVAETLRLSRAKTLLDACAGQGGKTLAFLSRQADLKVTCLEPNRSRYQGFLENFKRLGLERYPHPPEIKLMDLETFCREAVKDKLHFDQVLVDAPCSGLGVLAHKPEIKLGLSYAKIQEFPSLQLSLLEAAGSLVKDKGYLVYSTCTINPAENQEVVASFLASYPGRSFKPVALNPILDGIKFPYKDRLSEGLDLYGLTLRPDKLPTDGFFIACLKKEGEEV